MKSKSHSLTGLMSVFLTLPAAADVIYSNLQDIAIPANFAGVYLNVETGAWNTDINNPQTGWDINPFYGGSVLWNSPTFQPVRGGTGNMDVVLNLAAGTMIGEGSMFSTFVQEAGGEDPGGPGYGASRTHLGAEPGQFAAGEGYLGFRLNGTNYGWMRVVLTDNSDGALIKDWAYDNGGGGIARGNVLQNGAVVTLDSTFGSFALGSQLAGPNSVIKTGANTATLTNINLYTGATTVSAGTLAVAAAGSINTSSGVTVTAGAKFLHNSSTALTVPPTLSGAGVSNRAVLGGSGPINTSVTLDNPGDTLAPGNSPGVQAFTPAQTWSSFSYDWEINNFTGTTPGTDFDQLAIGATLDLTGSLGAYHLNMLSLTAGNVAGEVQNFSEIDRSWTVLTTAAGITGFDAANWTIHVDGFTNPATGGFALGQSGNNLVLSYTPVPEPSVAALLGTCGALALLRRRRACSGGL
jgi:autotransporter-associated beta strand protein